MKILFVNTNYKVGGAALAASRLADGLTQHSIDIEWYVKNTEVFGDNIRIFKRGLKDRIKAPFYKGKVTYSPYIYSTKKIVESKSIKDIDILHFHNLHGDYFNYTLLPYLTNKVPAVWTLHDMWSFTGHCAYSKTCGRWRTGCGQCPDLEEYPGVKIDGTRSEWTAKNKASQQSRLHIVTPSRWLGQLAEQSFLGQHPVSVIPYGLDTDLYSPQPKKEIRRKLGVFESRFTLLLCSANLSDPRKPQRVICESINEIFSEQGLPVQVIAFGSGSVREYLHPDIVLHEFGYIGSDAEKVELFSAADVFLFASRADNLPLVIQESLACGTPVIGNDVGGVSDMVINNETGWLLPELDKAAYTHAILEAATDAVHLSALTSGARDYATKHYSHIRNAEKYRAIYNKLIENR